MNRKGGIFDIFVFMVLALIVVVMIGVFIYMWGQVTTTLTGIETPPNNLNLNISQTAGSIFSPVNNNVHLLRVAGFFIIMGMALTIFVTSFFGRGHPVFLIVYLMMVVLGVAVSAFISNAYEDLLTGNALSTTWQADTMGNLILLNLPLVVAVIGIFGMILFFIGAVRDEDVGGAVI